MEITIPLPPGMDPLSDEAIALVAKSVGDAFEAGRFPRRRPPEDSPVWPRTPEGHVVDRALWRASRDGEVIFVSSSGRLMWDGPTRWEPERDYRPERYTYTVERLGGRRIPGLLSIEELRARWPLVLDGDAAHAALMLHGLFVFLSWIGRLCCDAGNMAVSKRERLAARAATTEGT